MGGLEVEIVGTQGREVSIASVLFYTYRSCYEKKVSQESA